MLSNDQAPTLPASANGAPPNIPGSAPVPLLTLRVGLEPTCICRDTRPASAPAPSTNGLLGQKLYASTQLRLSLPHLPLAFAIAFSAYIIAKLARAPTLVAIHVVEVSQCAAGGEGRE